MAYIPDRGDIIWITLNAQSGHEQSGRRPALVLSGASYNKKVELAILCPITSQVKGYPFEVLIPDGLEITGVILADQVKSLDWKISGATFIAKLPEPFLNEVIGKLKALIV